MTTANAFPNLEAKRARFLRFNGAARLGNLASTLMRAADQAADSESSPIVDRMLAEAQLFLHWDDTARDAAAKTALTDMRLGLERLERRWEEATQWNPDVAVEVAAKCRAYSDQALALSGLLDE
jgi:hypothetical protein